MKGLTKEELATRGDLVLALPERILSIPDGTAAPAKMTGGWGASANRTEIRFDSTSGTYVHVEFDFLVNLTHVITAFLKFDYIHIEISVHKNFHGIKL